MLGSTHAERFWIWFHDRLDDPQTAREAAEAAAKAMQEAEEAAELATELIAAADKFDRETDETVDQDQEAAQWPDSNCPWPESKWILIGSFAFPRGQRQHPEWVLRALAAWNVRP